MLDGNSVKAMPGLIPAPNPGSYNNWKRMKIQVAKWGTPKKYLKKQKQITLRKTNKITFVYKRMTLSKPRVPNLLVIINIIIKS